MTAPWRLVSADVDPIAGHVLITFTVGVDQLAHVPVTPAAWESGAWREVVALEAAEMMNAGAIKYAPRRKYR